MTPDQREPAGEQGSVEVAGVEMASGEPVEAQRTDRGQDVALDAASVLSHGAGAGGLDIGQPAGEQVAYAATMVGGRLLVRRERERERERACSARSQPGVESR